MWVTGTYGTAQGLLDGPELHWRNPWSTIVSLCVEEGDWPEGGATVSSESLVFGSWAALWAMVRTASLSEEDLNACWLFIKGDYETYWVHVGFATISWICRLAHWTVDNIHPLILFNWMMYLAVTKSFFPWAAAGPWDCQTWKTWVLGTREEENVWMSMVTPELLLGFYVSLCYVSNPSISGCGRLPAKMSLILHLSLDPHHLQCGLGRSSYPELESAFSHLGPELLCDWLWWRCGCVSSALRPPEDLPLLLAPLESCSHCVNRPVITCRVMADIWLSHCCNHRQQLDNHLAPEWGHPRPAMSSSPPGDYT